MRNRLEKKNWLLYPEDKYKITWDMIVSVTLLIMSIYTPMSVAFAFEHGSFSFQSLINFFMDGVFGLDIIVVFFSAYYNEDFKIIDDRSKIATKYLKGWFVIDFVAIIPFD